MWDGQQKKDTLEPLLDDSDADHLDDGGNYSDFEMDHDTGRGGVRSQPRGDRGVCSTVLRHTLRFVHWVARMYVLCCAVLCCAVLCRAVPCRAVLCCVACVLCCAAFCCVVCTGTIFF